MKTVHFADEDHATNWAIAWLRKQGYSTFQMKAADWATPAQLARRAGLNSSTIHYRLSHVDCPRTARIESSGGRLKKVMVTSELLEWIQRPAAPGLRSDLAGRIAA